MQKTVLLIDDDLMSRELIGLVLGMEGYAVSPAESGDAALETLRHADSLPQIILTDMQMPGLSGKPLAEALRQHCGGQTVLLGMSATRPAEDVLTAFNGFLLKPFNGAQFSQAASQHTAISAATTKKAVLGGEALDEAVYAKLAAAMPAASLQELYAVCLRDARERALAMQSHINSADVDAFRTQAHAIKGSCSLLGAVQLRHLATSMETKSFPPDHADNTLHEFLAECERLESILNKRFNGQK
jgi:CheY-like chemotaxis protein